MRVARLVVLVFLLLTATSALWADGVPDPQMILDPILPQPPGAACVRPGPTFVSAIPVTLPFSFTITNPDTFYCFQNLDTVNTTWTDLTVTLPFHEYLMTSVSCATDGTFYAQCTVDPDPSAPTFALDFHWTGSPPPPIGYGAVFGFDVSPPGGGTCPADNSNPNCFKTGDTFGVTSSVAVPEPSSMILLASGVLGLWARRRSLRDRA
jgi:hypothetical protein